MRTLGPDSSLAPAPACHGGIRPAGGGYVHTLRPTAKMICSILRASFLRFLAHAPTLDEIAHNWSDYGRYVRMLTTYVRALCTYVRTYVRTYVIYCSLLPTWTRML